MNLFKKIINAFTNSNDDRVAYEIDGEYIECGPNGASPSIRGKWVNKETGREVYVVDAFYGLYGMEDMVVKLSDGGTLYGLNFVQNYRRPKYQYPTNQYPVHVDQANQYPVHIDQTRQYPAHIDPNYQYPTEEIYDVLSNTISKRFSNKNDTSIIKTGYTPTIQIININL